MTISRRKFALTTGAAMLAGFNTAIAQSESKIILGQSAAFTGPAAQLGIQFYNGAKLYFDQINAQGGINKRLIEIKNLDDGYEPDRCAENTRKLLAHYVRQTWKRNKPFADSPQRRHQLRRQHVLPRLTRTANVAPVFVTFLRWLTIGDDVFQIFLLQYDCPQTVRA